MKLAIKNDTKYELRKPHHILGEPTNPRDDLCFMCSWALRYGKKVHFTASNNGKVIINAY